MEINSVSRMSFNHPAGRDFTIINWIMQGYGSTVLASGWYLLTTEFLAAQYSQSTSVSIFALKFNYLTTVMSNIKY